MRNSLFILFSIQLVIILTSISLGSLFNTPLSLKDYWEFPKQNASFVPLVGTEKFLNSNIPLKEFKLNLATWHGFHKFQKIVPNSWNRAIINFEMDNGSILFVTIHPENILKLSKNRSEKSGIINKEKFTSLNLSLQHYNELKIEIINQNIEFSINKEVFTYTFPQETPQFFSIQSNNITTKLSKVSIFKNNQSILHTDFIPWKVILSSYALLNFIIILSWFYFKPNLYAQISFCITGLLAASLFFYYSFYFHGYPLQQEDPLFAQKEESKVFQNYQKSFEQKNFLFFGGSQAFGEGASKKEKAWPSLVCRKFNLECINLSLRSGTYKNINHFLDMLPRNLLNKTQKVFISLNLNETDPEYMSIVLSKAYQQFQNKMILILEPVYLRPYQYLETHLITKQFCSNTKTQCVNAHQYFFDKRDNMNYWWDFIHLNDNGHHLLFDLVASKISTDLQK